MVIGIYSKIFTFYVFILQLKLIFNLEFLESTSTNQSFNNHNKINKINHVIKSLEKSILEEQCKKDIEFRPFPPRFNQIEGIFKSYIHINNSGDHNDIGQYALREKLNCMDMNMFVTNFVLTIFAESHELGAIELRKDIFLKGFKGMNQFRDKNYKDEIPIYTFWRQKNFGEYWGQYPDTMVGLMNNQPNTKWLIKICERLGLKRFADFLKTFNGYWDMFSQAYIIPSDLDDTFTSLALTSYLKYFNIPEFNSAWVDKNKNIKGLFKEIKRLVYKPFSSEEPANPLDPRTYFWIHEYVIKMKNENKLNFSIPMTWLWSWEQEKHSFKHVSIPFHGNNIDLNVVSNFLYGISNLAIYDKESNQYFDDEFLNIVENVGDLLEYVVENGIVHKRNDISLLYYPSVWDFYWMASRISSLVKNNKEKLDSSTEIAKLLLKINDKLNSVMKKNTVDYVISQLKYKNNNEHAFVVEFLGNYANKTRNEDAVFATGLAFNTLINMFTHKINNKIAYDEDATDEIKLIIDRMANFLLSSNSEFNVSKEGAFFSGSVHTTYSGLPYYYPADFFKYFNGTSFAPDDYTKIDRTASVSVYKYLTEEEFDLQLKRKHYGKDVPTKADFFANQSFPFWSAPAITESLSLLGLSKYKLLLEDNN
jgi:hypothetical protein